MRPAELLDQPVIASAGADRALCAYLIRDEFKHGAGVIIKTSYDVWIDNIFNVHCVEILLNALEVSGALVADIVGDNGGVLAYLLAYRAFAVEDPHRIFLEPLKAGAAKLALARFKILLERLVIILPALGAAYRVEMQLDALNAEECKYLVCERDYLGVRGG